MKLEEEIKKNRICCYTIKVIRAMSVVHWRAFHMLPCVCVSVLVLRCDSRWHITYTALDICRFQCSRILADRVIKLVVGAAQVQLFELFFSI